MKEAIGGTWLFGIVIVFIVFFTTYISMSTNYSKAFKVKDELISIVERYKGVNGDSIEKINNYLGDIGYFSRGKCDNGSGIRANFTDWAGCTYNNNRSCVKNASNANYCIRRSKFVTGDSDAAHPRSAHYQVVVFFTIDWPVLGSLINVRIEGETGIVHMFNDESRFLQP